MQLPQKPRDYYIDENDLECFYVYILFGVSKEFIFMHVREKKITLENLGVIMRRGIPT